MYIRIVLTVVLVCGILWYLDGVDELIRIIQSADILILGLAVLVVTIDRALMTYKWLNLLKSRSIEVPFLKGMRIYCASMIWAQFLPTGGADAIRAYSTYKHGFSGNEIVASIIVERMVGFLVALIFGLLGFIILKNYINIGNGYDSWWWLGWLSFLFAIIVFAVSFSDNLFHLLDRITPEKLMNNKIFRKLKELHETYLSYKASLKVMSYFFTLTAIENLVAIFLGLVIAWSLGIKMDPLIMFSVVPLTVLVSRLPISIDGIGVTEGVFIFLMSFGGYTAAEAVSISLLARVMQIIGSLPWWLAFVFENKKITPPQSA